MTEQDIITKFKSFDGRSIKRSELLSFYESVKKLKHASDQCVSIRIRLARALKKMNGGTYTITVKSMPVVRAVTVSKNITVEEDLIVLSGLEQLQDDKDLDGKPLDGISDTTYKVVTDKIISLIKSDGLIWRKPWNSEINGDEDLAHNGVTKHTYRGGNFWLNFLCGPAGIEKYSKPMFFTFKQVTDLKGTVKKGEKAWPVVYFKWLYKSQAKDKLVDDREALDNEGKLKQGYTRIPGLFYYSVFNYDQCTGIAVKFKPAPVRTEKEKIESAEKIVEGMPKRPTIIKGNDRAYYSPSKDHVVMPQLRQFKNEADYYSIFFHELIHSTGHESRVGRTFGGQGTKQYYFEELIAEIGACFLCAESGILYHTMNNSAAYVKGYKDALIKEMTDDPKFFLSACSAAQKAADFILGDDHVKKSKPKKKDFKPKSRGKKEREPVARNKTKTSKTAIKRVSAPDAKASSVERKVPVPHAATVVSGLGFTSADKTPDQPKKVFRLPGVIGDLLGNLQAYKLEIIIGGETHSGKSELGKQIADAFLTAGYSVGWVDWEQGGLHSRDTMESIERNVSSGNRSKLQVSGTVPKTLDAVKSLAAQFQVVCLDSATSLRIHTNAWIEELREEFPSTIWILLFQLTDKGTTRGGSSAEFDAPIVLKTYRPDQKDYTKNYAYVFKDRGNPACVGNYYSTPGKKILGKDFDPEAISDAEEVEQKQPEETATINL